MGASSCSTLTDAKLAACPARNGARVDLSTSRSGLTYGYRSITRGHRVDVTECWPTVALEAKAVCRSVGTTARGGIVDLVDDGITRILVDPGHRVALSIVLRIN